MTRVRRALACCLLVGLGGCAFPASPRSHTDRATLAACRDHANQVYETRNRGDLYTINQTGLPYSASYLAGNQTNDLAARFSNEQIIDDCIRNTGTGISRDNAVVPPSEQP
jgi:hypothetical protein